MHLTIFQIDTSLLSSATFYEQSSLAPTRRNHFCHCAATDVCFSFRDKLTIRYLIFRLMCHLSPDLKKDALNVQNLSQKYY